MTILFCLDTPEADSVSQFRFIRRSIPRKEYFLGSHSSSLFCSFFSASRSRLSQHFLHAAVGKLDEPHKDKHGMLYIEKGVPFVNQLLFRLLRDGCRWNAAG